MHLLQADIHKCIAKEGKKSCFSIIGLLCMHFHTTRFKDLMQAQIANDTKNTAT